MPTMLLPVPFELLTQPGIAERITYKTHSSQLPAPGDHVNLDINQSSAAYYLAMTTTRVLGNGITLTGSHSPVVTLSHKDD